MVSEEGSGYFYSFRRNKKKGRKEGKISLKKYDPVARCHVTFGEKKLSRLKKRYVKRGQAVATSTETSSS